MLTRLIIRNFKRFDEIDLPLGNPVVFIGPNNSGKTTALQALALWETGLQNWVDKRSDKPAPEKRPGITIGRRDLIAIPVPTANLLWRDLHVRDIQRASEGQQTQNIRIEIIVEGVTEGAKWECGLEFDYANAESLYCRPLRKDNGDRMLVPEMAAKQRVAFLPPMSGLAAIEPKLEAGRINVLIGEGQTAQVLRNLCHRIAQDHPDQWREIYSHIRSLFGVEINQPEYSVGRGEITMSYRERSGTQLDISASGRGLQQILLLLAYLYTNPGTVLLLDEPDAHLEILRQRQIYQLLTQITQEQNSQMIIASHSEVVLNEAASRDTVIAFVGKPHLLNPNDRGSQALKALTRIGFDHYYQAEQKGWILYLEGATDLSILLSFARRLNHPALQHLERPFAHYVANQPKKAHEHFEGLREAKKDLRGIAIYDRLEQALPPPGAIKEVTWQRREIENYLCQPETLIGYAIASAQENQPGPLFVSVESDRRKTIMTDSIADTVPPFALRDPSALWWKDVKASEDFLNHVFESFCNYSGYR
jgi:energy-coupling factor transporter ATP-binding protein EcfA2